MKNKPLTLEQIREYGENPYWHVALQNDSPKPHWQILDPIVAKHAEYYGYGKRWVAYPYKPMYIDRESWKPCEECVSCSNCKNQEDYDPYEGILGECAHCYCHENFEPYNFCHECGRPLTPKAWDVLEKRISVGE